MQLSAAEVKRFPPRTPVSTEAAGRATVVAMRAKFTLTPAVMTDGARLLTDWRRIVLVTGGMMIVTLLVMTLWKTPLRGAALRLAPLALAYVVVGLMFGVAMALLQWFVVLPWNMRTLHRQNLALFGETTWAASA